MNYELAKKLSGNEKRCGLNAKRLFDEHADCEAKSRKFTWDFGYMHNNQPAENCRCLSPEYRRYGLGVELQGK